MNDLLRGSQTTQHRTCRYRQIALLCYELYPAMANNKSDILTCLKQQSNCNKNTECKLHLGCFIENLSYKFPQIKMS